MTDYTQNTLLNSAVQYLQEMRGKWGEVEQATGLTKHWMASIAQGKREGPDVNKIELLLRHAGRFPYANKENEAA